LKTKYNTIAIAMIEKPINPRIPICSPRFDPSEGGVDELVGIVVVGRPVIVGSVRVI
jgi:hypothetical protein